MLSLTILVLLLSFVFFFDVHIPRFKAHCSPPVEILCHVFSFLNSLASLTPLRVLGVLQYPFIPIPMYIGKGSFLTRHTRRALKPTLGKPVPLLAEQLHCQATSVDPLCW